MSLNEGSKQISSQIVAKKSLGSCCFDVWVDFHWNH